MAKHKRYSDNQKSNSVQKDETTELIEEEITSQKISNDPKTILLSGVKYAYIIAAAALLSGIFTPLTIGTDVEIVFSGMLSIFLGLGGGILIFLGIRASSQKLTNLMICGGLGMMIGSFVLIHELAGRSIF